MGLTNLVLGLVLLASQAGAKAPDVMGQAPDEKLVQKRTGIELCDTNYNGMIERSDLYGFVYTVPTEYGGGMTLVFPDSNGDGVGDIGDSVACINHIGEYITDQKVIDEVHTWVNFDKVSLINYYPNKALVHYLGKLIDNESIKPGYIEIDVYHSMLRYSMDDVTFEVAVGSDVIDNAIGLMTRELVKDIEIRLHDLGNALEVVGNNIEGLAKIISGNFYNEYGDSEGVIENNLYVLVEAKGSLGISMGISIPVITLYDAEGNVMPWVGSDNKSYAEAAYLRSNDSPLIIPLDRIYEWPGKSLEEYLGLANPQPKVPEFLLDH